MSWGDFILATIGFLVLIFIIVPIYWGWMSTIWTRAKLNETEKFFKERSYGKKTEYR